VDERKYIVFEFDVPDVREDAVKGPEDRELEDLPVKVRLEEVSIRPKEAADARRRPNRSVSMPMPISLIAPVSQSESAAPDGPGETWGVRAIKAHTSPYSGEGVAVAVLDTGLQKDHEAFADIPEVTVRDFTDTGENDDAGHGTHCAGTIAGRDVNGYRFGVARGISRLIGAKVLSPASTTLHVAAGINWALTEGANVVSMSLGLDFPKFVRERIDGGLEEPAAISEGLTAYRESLELFDALANLAAALGKWGRWCVFIAASGNESKRPDYRLFTSPPAVADRIISVGAVMQAGGGFDVTYFSNMGAKVAAPGQEIFSAKAGGGYRLDSGTSMATPHVAGVAALWADQLLKTTGRVDTDVLLHRIVGSATLMGLNQDDVGAGLVQAPGQEANDPR
jgi:subtilisin family serine protease